MRKPIDPSVIPVAAFAALWELCKKHKVRNLFLFGSAVDSTFNPSRSDIDFLVEFETMTPNEHMQNYFGLYEDLEALLQQKIDLVELESVKNPYIMASIRKSQVSLYAAA